MSRGEQSRTVLIVDDDADFTANLRASLSGAGYEVVVASTAAEGRRRWDGKPRERIDAAVVDLNLPDMSGIELIRQISGARTSTRILATTAALSPLHLEIAGYVGAHHAVTKFEPDAAAFPASAWVRAIDELLTLGR
jgi:CheY-like chemotaxis protein